MLPARAMPTMPTNIQNPLSKVYAGSRFMAEHQVSITASMVLKIQTNMNGLSGPIQLTTVKLLMRISTPIISTCLMYFATNALGFIGYVALGGANVSISMCDLTLLLVATEQRDKRYVCTYR